jgi:hypothetical protein
MMSPPPSITSITLAILAASRPPPHPLASGQQITTAAQRQSAPAIPASPFYPHTHANLMYKTAT